VDNEVFKSNKISQSKTSSALHPLLSNAAQNPNHLALILFSISMMVTSFLRRPKLLHLSPLIRRDTLPFISLLFASLGAQKLTSRHTIIISISAPTQISQSGLRIAPAMHAAMHAISNPRQTVHGAGIVGTGSVAVTVEVTVRVETIVVAFGIKRGLMG
jgi:hypothetical protein